MNLLNKLTIKNLKLNKKRTVVTIIGILLSVALITAVASIYLSGIHSLIVFEIQQKGDFHAAYYDVPEKDISVFENHRGIEQISITQNIGYAKIDSKNEDKPYVFLKAFTQNALENLSVKLVEGRLPQAENEIVIPTHLKTNGRVTLSVGETITLDVGKRVDAQGKELGQNDSYHSEDGTESIQDTIRKTYKIVGVIERPATNVEPYSAPGYTFLTYMDDAEYSGMVDVYAKYTDEGVKKSYRITADLLGIDEELFEKSFTDVSGMTEAQMKELSEEMAQAKYQIQFNSYLIGLQTDPIGNSSIGGLGVVVGIVMGIIVFTSIFCIKNSFDISITEKIKQYGMLRSIGATKKQIKRNVFFEASVLGIIGIPLGILTGFLASFLLVIISNYYLNAMLTDGLRLEFSFSFAAVGIAVLLGIVTIYFSAFQSARRAAKVSPIDSIRNSANIKIKLKKIKSPKYIKKVFGIGGELSYKNLKRNKKKYRTTVISISVSVFVFIALSSFMDLAFTTVDNQLETSEYNLSLWAYDQTDESYEKIIKTAQFDSVEQAAIVRESDLVTSEKRYNKEYLEWIQMESEQDMESHIVVMTVGEEEYNRYLSSLGLSYEEMKDKAILLDYEMVTKFEEDGKESLEKYMRLHDWKVGENISGVVDGKTQIQIEIGAISKEQPFSQKNRDIVKMIVSDEWYDTVIGKNSDVEIFIQSSDPNRLQDDIDVFLQNEIYNVNNNEENARMMNNLFTLIGIFLYGFIIVVSLIGITNIFNTITTNMELRRQEFAMLKSIGMTTYEFNRMVRLESLFMGMKSLITGIPIGLILSYILYYNLAYESGFPYEPPVLAIGIAVVTVFILIFIIMKYSVRKIQKQNTIETIRNENI